MPTNLSTCLYGWFAVESAVLWARKSWIGIDKLQKWLSRERTWVLCPACRSQLALCVLILSFHDVTASATCYCQRGTLSSLTIYCSLFYYDPLRSPETSS